MTTSRRAMSVCVLAGLAAATGVAAQEPVRVPAKLSVLRGGLGNVMSKLKGGGDVRVAYIGGSVTAAAGWRVQTFDWLKKQYPTAKLAHTNAAIGGTGSDLGVFRMRKDVLDHKPDLVFVEFSINDGSRKPADVLRSVEGMVRQTWRADPTTDICFVYVYSRGYQKHLEQGMCAPVPSAHDRVAAHYGIPSINVALRIAHLVRDGKMVVKAKQGTKTDDGKTIFSHDGVHPLRTTGHAIYTDIITDALEAMANEPKPMRHKLGTPLVADNWEKAKLVGLEPWMHTAGWRKVDRTKGWGKQYASDFPAVWEADKPGEKITFTFKGTMVAVYDVIGPRTGQVVLTVDGKATLRNRFDPWCTCYYRRHMFTVAKGLEDKLHTVSIAVSDKAPDVMPGVRHMARHGRKIDPESIKGTVLRIGYLMLVGDVVRDGSAGQ